MQLEREGPDRRRWKMGEGGGVRSECWKKAGVSIHVVLLGDH